MHRQIQRASGQIPQRQVSCGQFFVGQRALVQPLPFFESLPQSLAIKRVLAQQRRPHDLLDRGGIAAETIALDPLIGDDPHHALGRLVSVPRMRMPFCIPLDLRRVGEYLGGHIDNPHVVFLSPYVFRFHHKDTKRMHICILTGRACLILFCASQ